QTVAAELVTVVHDGTIANRRGSLNVDDEGTPTQRTVLIEGGVLRGYLQDKLNARLMGMPVTGNGRRESYAHAPMPRMTNTFMLAGQDDPEDIIRSVDRGLFAVTFGGGQVDITSGRFVFSANEAYLIEGGRVTAEFEGLLASVLERATTRGATAADGFLVEEREFSATVRMGEVEQVAHSHAQRLSLRVFAGRASAAASTSDLSAASLERVVD